MLRLSKIIALAAAVLLGGVQAHATANYTFTTTNTGTMAGNAGVTSVANTVGSGGSGTGAYTMVATGEATSMSGGYFGPYNAAGQAVPQYFSTGADNLRLSFNAAQQYLGLIIGTNDPGAHPNLITFYKSGAQVGQISSNDIANAPDAQQMSNRSYYLNVNFMNNFSFDQVLFSGASGYSFEFANIVASAADVPEPTMLGLFGLGVIGLAVGRRRAA